MGETLIFGTGDWYVLDASVFTATTGGGLLSISLDLPIYAMDSAEPMSCRPTVDGRWAGAYEGLPNFSDYGEGTIIIPQGSWLMWSKTRHYGGIPAGTHTFAIECRAAFGNDGRFAACMAPNTCFLGVLEVR